MKLICSTLAMLALVASTIPSLAGWDGVNHPNCTWGHGTSAQGYAPAPQLAGQKPRYMETQLRSFRAHTRDNPFSKLYMWGAEENLSTDQSRYLALHFAALPSKPAKDGNQQKLVAGRTLFEDGDHTETTAACAVCHGPDAQGIRDIPRLGGLWYFYLRRKLKQWREGYHATAKCPVPA